MSNWSHNKLNELGFVGRGKSKHRPRNEPSLYGGQYPFIQTGDIKTANLYISEYSQTYNENGLAQSKLWNPGTLCITIAANIAETAILKIGACFPDSIVGFVADPKKADVRFTKYYIDTIKLEMQNVSKGTTQDNLSLDKLLSFDFIVPPLSTQHKLASILSAYDDLIENNNRRIKILEEMAQAIYREWFVNFRFPGHEKYPRPVGEGKGEGPYRLVNSELGMIPEGWEVTKIGEVLLELESGSRPKGGIDSSERGVPSVGAENILGLGQYDYTKEKYVRKEFHNNMRRGHVKSKDVLLYKDGAQIGRKSMFQDSFPHETCCINEHVFILRVNARCSQNYLYFWLDQPDMTQNIRNLNVNAAQPGINQAGVKGLPILLPQNKLINTFENIVEPLLSELFNLAKKNNVLSQTRDLLLPKLISGEIDVEGMEIKISEEVN